MNAAAVELAGTLTLKILNMENTKKIYRIPRDKLDQVISRKDSTEARRRAPGPGHKHQASGSKHQASSAKLVKHQAASIKPQA